MADHAAIWATWYDLPEATKDDHLGWLHGSYLPALAGRAGYAWVAHYAILPRVQNPMFVRDPSRQKDGADIGDGTQFLLLDGAGSPHAFLDGGAPLPGQEDEPKLLERGGARSCIFLEEERVAGPDHDAAAAGGTSAPAIQMGSFRMKSLEDEMALGAWYAQARLRSMENMPGCVATRKLVSTAGWAKHGVLYEFVSLEQREKYFFKALDKWGKEDIAWSREVIETTVHAPGSPSVGERTWPEVTP